MPLLAVAAGSHVHLYKNLKPHSKFTLPPAERDGQRAAAGGDGQQPAQPQQGPLSWITCMDTIKQAQEQVRVAIG